MSQSNSLWRPLHPGQLHCWTLPTLARADLAWCVELMAPSRPHLTVVSLNGIALLRSPANGWTTRRNTLQYLRLTTVVEAVDAELPRRRYSRWGNPLPVPPTFVDARGFSGPAIATEPRFETLDAKAWPARLLVRRRDRGPATGSDQRLNFVDLTSSGTPSRPWVDTVDPRRESRRARKKRLLLLLPSVALGLV